MSLAVLFWFFLPFDLDPFGWELLCFTFLFIFYFWAVFGLDSFAVIASGCWRFVCLWFLFCVRFYFVWFCWSGFTSAFKLLSITPFSLPDVSFPPAFHYVTPPVSAMHLGNQESESDAEDEVNHTFPTMCCPLHQISSGPALLLYAFFFNHVLQGALPAFPVHGPL